MDHQHWSRKKGCDEVETVREFTYAGGGYEAAVTDRTRCSELLHENKLYPNLKRAIYKS